MKSPFTEAAEVDATPPHKVAELALAQIQGGFTAQSDALAALHLIIALANWISRQPGDQP